MNARLTKIVIGFLVMIFFNILPSTSNAEIFDILSDVANSALNSAAEGAKGYADRKLNPQNSNQNQASNEQANDTNQFSGSLGSPSGTITVSCGCYGNIQIGATRPSNVCASGVEQVVQCKGGCKRGGVPVASVCQ